MYVIFHNRIESIKEQVFKDNYIDKLKYFNLKMMNHAPPVFTHLVGDFVFFDNNYRNYICFKSNGNKYLFKTKLKIF